MGAYNQTASADSWPSPEQQEVRRHKLIPTWIKVIGWIFMVAAASVPFFFLLAILTDYSTTYTLFGVRYEGNVLAPLPVIFAGWLMVPGVCAYGLLFGKNWGLAACLVWGYITLGGYLYGMFSGQVITLQLEIIILFFYLRRLHKMRPHW